MKIRRYKGPDRDALYRAIHREMGPDAVVVAPDTGGFSLLGRPQRYELIAILEESGGRADGTSEGTGINPSNDGLTAALPRWQRQQTRQWRDVQASLRELKQTVCRLQKQPPGGGTMAFPDSIAAWDPRLLSVISDSGRSGSEISLASARRVLIERMKVAADCGLAHPERKPHVIALTGPTGSGKTTTLAKLAARCVFQRKMKVGMITTDTFRVAAVDQIREYASLLDVDLRVVFSAEEARAAVGAMHQCDVIFVDTPGRAQFDGMGLAAVQNVLRGFQDVTVMLTIPATISRDDVADVLNGFGRFKPDYLVVTKIDETRCPLVFTVLPFESPCPVAFVTNGQRVPQDITDACADRIADLLIPSECLNVPQRLVDSVDNLADLLNPPELMNGPVDAGVSSSAGAR